jgi:hypothetical protein
MAFASVAATNNPARLAGATLFSSISYRGERITTFQFDPEVRVQINAPSTNVAFSKRLMVFYALPNGNTIEETAGKPTSKKEEWRYQIQHIAAQMRFVRAALPDHQIVIAYLEAAGKSWPAWRKKHGNEKIPDLLERVAEAAGCPDAPRVLNGHSGGGSLIFGFINAVPEIPTNVVRIAFLDSNYAYDTSAGHSEKLLKWLRNDGRLCVIAYNDAAGLLDGKPFVSASGGTWGRSHAMWKDFAAPIEFSEFREGDLLRLTGLSGRVEFLLMENPDHKILHTVQVERNGFIHSMLFATPAANKGYKYYGEPAYKRFIWGEN